MLVLGMLLETLQEIMQHVRPKECHKQTHANLAKDLLQQAPINNKEFK